MPTYTYKHEFCDNHEGLIEEINVPMDQRDAVSCKESLEPLVRKISFTGLTWAPTAGGMR